MIDLRVAHGGHLGNWGPYWTDLNAYIVVYSSTELSTCSNISLIPQAIFLTACCHLRQNQYYPIAHGGHLGNWWPYWNNLNIWIVFITLIVHFAWSKHTLCCHNNLFDHLLPFLRQKIKFQDTPWQPSWKMAAILKFCVARVIFLNSDPHRVFVPNLLLVS